MEGENILAGHSPMSVEWYRSVGNDKFTDQKPYHSAARGVHFKSEMSPDGSCVTVETDGGVLIEVAPKLSKAMPYALKYKIWADGTIDMDASFTKPAGTEIIRRMGLRFALKNGHETVSWYGKGPHENYCDRSRSASVGIWNASVDDFASEHYVRSQSMGNREDVRWFTVTDASGKGIKVETLSGNASFSALHYTDADLWRAKHDFRLPEIRRRETLVSIDAAQQGLGNATCGPRPLEEYMIPEGVPAGYKIRISRNGSSPEKQDMAAYADPMVGTAYTGHTFPGAAYPFGMMQPGPHTGNFGWEHCSGYNNDDEKIWGFGQNHLNGTGCPDLGDLLMMPFSGECAPDFKSAWDKETEFAVPGYYRVFLTDNKVLAEMTCSPHVAMHKYGFRGPDASLFIDFQSAQMSSVAQYDSHVLEAEVNFESPSLITGHHHVTGWVTRHFYYAIQFDTPVADTVRIAGAPANKAPKYVFRFPDGTKELLVKVAISTVSIDEARKNLLCEAPEWDFDGMRDAARDKWNEYFSLIEADGSPDQLSNFYTSFYHLLIQPNNIADVSGLYRGADDKVRMSESGKYFSTLSLWDTFRAAHPFYALMMPDLAASMVNNMLDHSEAFGFLPIWALWGKENYCMIGNHAVPVVADACLKGLPGVDPERAFAAVKRSLTEPHYRADWDIYDKYGYYPFDLVKEESASRTLECAYDDWCAAALAKSLGKDSDAELFMKRSGYWKNLFDSSNGLIRGKDSKGEWRTPFDKFHLSHGGTAGGDYTEGNAWQYTWHVLHDVDGLAGLLGGKDAFMVKLDSLFTIETRAEATGFTGDVTGLIGQYAHGNEPSHHVAYLYSFLGNNARTAELVREIFDKFYLPRTDGLCGNDDCGQMSAWYMFSAMGFYPVDSISGEYVIGAPQIPYFRLHLPNGRILEIKASGLSEMNRYVKEVRLNGEPLENNIVTYAGIMDGGVLEYVMSDTK